MEHEQSRADARRNETMLRGANASMERDAEASGEAADRETDLLCECAEACGGTVRISFREWDEVHRDPLRFVVAPGHEDPAVERVVARGDRFLTVEKLPLGARS